MGMINCESCGAPIRTDEKSCLYCGTETIVAKTEREAKEDKIQHIPDEKAENKPEKKDEDPGVPCFFTCLGLMLIWLVVVIVAIVTGVTGGSS